MTRTNSVKPATALREYVSPERRNLEREKAYHEACIAQYRKYAAIDANEKRAKRVEENAQFHERQLEYVVARLGRVL